MNQEFMQINSWFFYHYRQHKRLMKLYKRMKLPRQ